MNVLSAKTASQTLAILGSVELILNQSWGESVRSQLIIGVLLYPLRQALGGILITLKSD